MKPWILGGVSSAALLAIPATAWSLTPQEAWQKWQDAATSYGQTLSNDGEETMDGKLTVRGVTLSSDMEDVSVTARIDEVVFADLGDGTVGITMSESIPVTAAGTDMETGEKVNVVITVAHQGLEMTASDADGGTAFAYTAPSMTLGFTEFKVDDVDFPMTLDATVSDSTGSYSVKAEDGNPVESQFVAAGLSIAMDAVDPEGSGTVKLSVTVDGLESDSLAVGLDAAETEDMASMLADGFAIGGKASYGPVAFDMEFQEGGSTGKAQGTLTGGGIDFALGADGMNYDVGYEGLDVAVSGSDIPFPQVTLKADAASTAFAIPVLVQEKSAPFALRTAIEGLQIGEEIWSMFDPGAVLPRDPATLIVDLAGTGRWSIDIFDEEAMMAVESSGQTPGEVETVDLKELKLAIGGAELTGQGAFTIDNSDMETFDGMPRPQGKASFALSGGNGLLENLAKMGLIPQDQVMMVRMMTGMFAKPGAGPDELVSEVEIDAGGQLLINGAPMPF